MKKLLIVFLLLFTNLSADDFKLERVIKGFDSPWSLTFIDSQNLLVTEKPGNIKFVNLKEKIISEIKKIYDPEIPVNIFELGLIYKIDVNEDRKVLIEMTLTSPNCPVAESLPNSVKENILKIDEVDSVDLKLVWNPPWTKDKMSELAKLELNL